MAGFEIHHGDALDVLRGMPDNSVDAIVTDPPAGIAFMGKEWDKDKGGRSAWIAWMSQIAAECLRVLKPGAHALVWAIPRTSHWTATAWEDAGFEVRDRIAHVFGSGFPKSLDVSKAIDKMYGAEREVVGAKDYTAPDIRGNSSNGRGISSQSSKDAERVAMSITAPATESAKQWEGWGTALKPAVEDWWLLRKPISESSIAANVLRWGTGGVNVDGCRVNFESGERESLFRPMTENKSVGWKNTSKAMGYNTPDGLPPASGRFPANLIHDGSAEVVGMFPHSHHARGNVTPTKSGKGMFYDRSSQQATFGGDTGSAARFFKACPPDDAASLFYCAKASRSERDAGLDGIRYKLRDDLTDEQRAFVMAELEACGVLKRQIDDA